MRTAIPALVLVLTAFWGRPAGAQVDCEAARCAVQTAIGQECSCTESSNHGRYVSCVAHAVKRLVSDGSVPVNCKGKVTRCAARSTCGKPGFVTCRIPLDTCDPTTLTCTANPTLTCATDIDCGSRCSTKRSTEACAALGGVPGAGTCCAACGS